MKLLFLTADKYPPLRVDVSVLFGEELAGRGHSIDWLMQSGEPARRAREERYGNGLATVGAAVAGNSAFAKAVRQIQGLLNDLRMVRMALATRYDVIQVKDKFVSAVLALVIARLTGTKFVYWLAFPFPEAWRHDVAIGASRHPLVSMIRAHVFGWMLYKLILPNADRAFVQSERMKQEIVAKGVSADRIVAVPMGVSPDLLSMRPCESPTGMEHPAVVYLGSMLRVRRLEMIIEAFSVVLERVPKARLYMIGGEHQADIEFLCGVARRLGVAERVTFTGNLPRAEALSMTRAADVCLSPIFPTAIFDVASPTKLVEYMALGKPVVGSQQPEQQQVLSESGAGLVAPFDAAAFATATAELLLDPLRAKAMGAAGREWVRNNRLYPCIAARLERAYDAVVSCSAPPAGEPETGRRL